MSTLIESPYPVFTDVDGLPLENGYVYIGKEGLNPISNPTPVFWDSALTIPAANIRTKNGYPYYNGTPGRLYVPTGSYSILVRNRHQKLVFLNLNASDYYNAPSGTVIKTIDTIADLRDFVPADVKISVRLLGYNAVGDGGGGPVYLWKHGAAPGTYVDTGARVIVPTGGDGSAAWVWDYHGPAFIEWINNDILLANADQEIKEIVLHTGKTYTLASPLLMRPGLIIGSDGSFDQAGIAFNNLAKIVLAAGFNGDAIQFSSGDAAAEFKGIYLDCSNQVAGDGISFLTAAEVRNMCRLTNVVVRNAAGRGIYEQEKYKGNVFENVYVIGSGSHGIESQTLDGYKKRIWSSDNVGHGIYLPRPASGDAGGNRYEDVDCWNNGLSGIVEEQAGDTWVRTQVDLNHEEGLILRNRANNNAFLGVKIRSGSTGVAGTFAAILFEDGAASGPFGNLLVDITAIDGSAYHSYLIEDTCAIQVNNVIGPVSVSLDGGGFSKGIFNPAVRRGSTISNVTHVPRSGGVSTYLYPVMKEGQENLILNGTMDHLNFELNPTAWTKSTAGIAFTREAGTYSRFMGKAVSGGGAAFESVRQFLFDLDKIKGKVVHLTGYAMAPATNALNACVIGVFSDAVPVEQAIPNDGVWRPIDIRASIGGGAFSARIQATMTGGVATAGEILYIDEMALTFNDIPLTSQHRLEGTLDFKVFDSADSTPSVRGVTRAKTANAAPTTITNFDDGYQGQQILIVFGDAITTIDFSANANLNGNSGVDFVGAVGDSLLAIFDGTAWYCFISKN